MYTNNKKKIGMELVTWSLFLFRHLDSITMVHQNTQFFDLFSDFLGSDWSILGGAIFIHEMIFQRIDCFESMRNAIFCVF